MRVLMDFGGIYGSKSKTLLGYKKTLVFYQGKPQANPTKTSWIVEEYKIDLNIIQSESDDFIWTSWVVCKVYNKEKDPRKIEVNIEPYSLFKSNSHPIFPQALSFSREKSAIEQKRVYIFTRVSLRT